VSAETSVTISASIAGGAAQTATMRVTAPVAALSVLETPSQTVGAGQPIQITARLTAAAPSSGTVVTLTSSSQVLPVPPSVTVPGGNTTAVAKLTVQAASSDSSVVVTGAAGGQNRTLAFTVWPVFLQFTSMPGDFVGAGKSMHLDAGPSSWIFNGNMWDGNNKLQITMVNASHTNSYTIFLAAPNGAPLTAGVYPIARRIPNPGEAQIDIGGDGRSCYQSTGRLEVLEAAYGPGLANMSGSVERFRATFTQTCDVTPPATGGMSGEIRLATIPFNCTINKQC